MDNPTHHDARQPTDPSPSVRQALSLARGGRLDEAENVCRRLVADAPRHFEALALLGTLAENRGRLEEAVRWLGRAAEVRPQAADVIAARATVLRSLGRDEEALEDFDRALEIRPDYVAAIFNRGNTLLTLQRYEAALGAFDRLLELVPDDSGALTHRGIALFELGRVEEALASHDSALTARPESVGALVNRSNCLHALGRDEDAEATLRRALTLAPGDVDARVVAATAAQHAGRHEDAVAHCDVALSADPRHIDALRIKAEALQALNRHPEALPAAEAAFAAQPDAAGAITVGNSLHTLGRYEEALEAADRALELEPRSAPAENNRGNALRALGRYEEALASYARAITHAPDNANAHWNQGLTRLTQGDYGRGWEGYEWRTRGLSDGAELLRPQLPIWNGSDNLDGKKILLIAEQGFGDAIQFVRYAPRIAALGGEIVLICGKPLQRLLRTVEGIEEVRTTDDPTPRADFQILLPSLPHAFGTEVATIPAAVPYVTVDAERAAHWRDRVTAASRARAVGLVWRSNPDNPAAWTRDCPVEALRPLFELADTRLFSLQTDELADDVAALVERHGVVDLAGELTDFHETAAAISALDQVVTVDTAVAHLTGALGHPGHVMLRYSADWRWLLDRDDSPWYPRLRLHRQRSPGDWEPVVRAVVDAL